MKVTELFARAAALVSGKEPSTRAAVEVALRDCEARATSAAAELEKLAPRRAELLVDGSDAEVAKHDDAVSRTTLERDRAAAIAAKLKERLAVFVAEEAAAELARRRSEVEMECEMAADTLRARYPKLVAEGKALLRILVKAQIARDGFARAYPGEAPIPDPELAVRLHDRKPDEVVSETKEWRWALADGRALPANVHVRLRPQLTAEEKVDLAKRRHAHERRHGNMNGFNGSPSTEIRQGMLDAIVRGEVSPYVFETSYGDEVRYILMVRRELRRSPQPNFPDRLASALKLPPLREDGEHESWIPSGIRVLDASEMLAKLQAEPVKPWRSVIVEYLPA